MTETAPRRGGIRGPAFEPPEEPYPQAAASADPAPRKRISWPRAIATHALLLAATGLFVVPLVWMVLTGLKPEGQTLKSPPEWIPRTPTAVLARTHFIDANGLPQRIAEPKPERIAVEKMRQLDAPETMVVMGAAEGERPGEGALEGQRLLVKPKDVQPPGGGWGDAAAPGPARLRIRDAVQKKELDCTVVRTYEPGMWVVREYVPDTRQATRAGKGAGVTYAWDVVPESEIQERVQFMWANVPVSLNKMNFMRMLLNTLWVCILGMIGTTFASALVAYGFAFGAFPGRKLLFALTLATMMVPFPATMVPMFQVYRDLDWIGTFKPLWVHSWFGAAFNIFLLRQFFLGLPRDLLDAARIDGCSELEIFWHVVVPLSRPALAMVALFHFLYAWKDFMAPLLFLTDKSQFTLSLGLHAFQSQQGGTPWHLVMAASAVFSIPLIVLFLVAMKTFIRGIAMTGIKG
ncbi:MAG: carbohydrate ABC transporter permease [Planctomycetes bacterium]|nr:carbohydrate ABC transporter permease [Planctomycetota bacterium]